jgi:hypothetical protein
MTMRTIAAAMRRSVSWALPDRSRLTAVVAFAFALVRVPVTFPHASFSDDNGTSCLRSSGRGSSGLLGLFPGNIDDLYRAGRKKHENSLFKAREAIGSTQPPESEGSGSGHRLAL